MKVLGNPKVTISSTLGAGYSSQDHSNICWDTLSSDKGSLCVSLSMEAILNSNGHQKEGSQLKL